MSETANGRDHDLGTKDFDAIREAVMETPRGRWFLGEFESRLRKEGTSAVLDSMKRLETAVSHNHDAIMQRLAEALARGPAVEAAPQATAPQPDLAPRHMKFFKQDEDIFEPAPQAQIAVAPVTPKPVAEAKPAVPKGAKLVIRRSGEATPPEAPVEAVPAAASPQVAEEPAPEVAAAPQPEPVEAAQASEPPAAAEPKRRIVIIRHKRGEEIDVPLQNEMAEAG